MQMNRRFSNSIQIKDIKQKTLKNFEENQGRYYTVGLRHPIGVSSEKMIGCKNGVGQSKQISMFGSEAFLNPSQLEILS